MKLFFILILLISLISCTNTDQPTVDKSDQDSLLVEVDNKDVKNTAEKESKSEEFDREKYVKEINSLVGTKISTCLESKPSMTHTTGDWHYCFLEEDNMEIVVITTNAARANASNFFFKKVAFAPEHLPNDRD